MQRGVSAPAIWDYVHESFKNETLSDIRDKEHTYALFPPSALAVWDYVDSVVGDIDAALDAILAIQETLVGGVN